VKPTQTKAELARAETPTASTARAAEPRAGEAKATTVGANTKRRASAAADPDVAVIEAIMRNADAVDGQRAVPAAAASPAAASRDVVLRTPNASTESLLARCRALSAPESDYCHARICSGVWAKEPACAK
jgi:hypothetical protein